jgi:hypothetical protein
MEYTYRRSGTNVCELVDSNGEVFAWTVSVGWAAYLTNMLNVIGNTINGTAMIACESQSIELFPKAQPLG